MGHVQVACQKPGQLGRLKQPGQRAVRAAAAADTSSLATSPAAPLLPPAVALAEQGPVHTVRAGETLYSIARTYGVRMSAIAAINGMELQRRVSLRVGECLALPTEAVALGSLAAETTGGGGRGGLQPGPGSSGSSSGSRQARGGGKEGVATGVADAGIVTGGARTSAGLLPSTASRGKEGGGGYVVQPGDTPETIARHLGVTVEEFWQLATIERAPRLRCIPCEQAALQRANQGATPGPSPGLVSAAAVVAAAPETSTPFFQEAVTEERQLVVSQAAAPLPAFPRQGGALDVLGLGPSGPFSAVQKGLLLLCLGGAALVWGAKRRGAARETLGGGVGGGASLEKSATAAAAAAAATAGHQHSHQHNRSRQWSSVDTLAAPGVAAPGPLVVQLTMSAAATAVTVRHAVAPDGLGQLRLSDEGELDSGASRAGAAEWDHSRLQEDPAEEEDLYFSSAEEDEEEDDAEYADEAPGGGPAGESYSNRGFAHAHAPAHHAYGDVREDAHLQEEALLGHMNADVGEGSGFASAGIGQAVGE
eukprot:jgi/Mesen1/427/ME000100S10663